MFTVYNKGSVQFRGTSDNLYNLEKVEQLSKTRLNPDNDFFQYIDNDQDKNKQNSTLDDALSQYKKILKMDTTEIVYSVQDIMSKDCITILDDVTLQEAYELLREKKISNIPIITNSRHIVGIINKKIILNEIMNSPQDIEFILRQKLTSINLADTITTDPISDIRRVAKVMLDYKLDAIPVVNANDVLVGIISKTDIIKAVSYIPNLKLWA